jgi:hypothetical protein
MDTTTPSTLTEGLMPKADFKRERKIGERTYQRWKAKGLPTVKFGLKDEYVHIAKARRFFERGMRPDAPAPRTPRRKSS